MKQTDAVNSIERNSDLVVAAVYEREIGASLERVWENVHDWEHLPYLHSQAFHSISLIDSGDWGWRVTVELADGSQSKIELIVDRDARRYVSRTLKGTGASAEFWTSLDPLAEHKTAIHVEFCVPAMAEQVLRRYGKALVGLYTHLWTQDEDMMQTRTAALAERRATPEPADPAETISLGSIDDLSERLPLVIELGGHSFRVVEVDGEFKAHSTECPHRLGPLGDCAINDGIIACPWHGYQFDVRTSRSSDGQSFRLRPPPQIEVDAATGSVIAHFEKTSSGISSRGDDHGSS